MESLVLSSSRNPSAEYSETTESLDLRDLKETAQREFKDALKIYNAYKEDAFSRSETPNLRNGLQKFLNLIFREFLTINLIEACETKKIKSPDSYNVFSIPIA